jgi:signal transduction histidine kinase
MEYSFRSCLTGIRKTIINPTFWGILFIILALTFIYYSHILFISLTDPRWEWLWYLIIFEYKYDINCSLFFIPFVYAAIIFRWKVTLAIWLFSIGLILPRLLYITPNIGAFVTNIVFLVIPLLVVVIIALLEKWKETEEASAKEREEERQGYLAQIIKTQEEERTRISREIHDDTTQRLWILANRTQKLLTDELRTSMPKMVTELEDVKKTLLDISEDTRRLSIALRPGILDNLGLVSAIRWLIDQLINGKSIEAKVFLEDPPRQLTRELSTQLFRIAQEALNNVRRHAEATQINVKFKFNSDTVKMTIQDNGKGFPFKDIQRLYKQNKLGLLGIRERVRLLDGNLKINSRPNKGTSLSVEFKY